MDKKKRKATIDDGMNPELVKGADFDGYLGIPMIKKPVNCNNKLNIDN
mgnify:CR=1 FL=1